MFERLTHWIWMIVIAILLYIKYSMKRARRAARTLRSAKR
jgi:hypothetical protein